MVWAVKMVLNLKKAKTILNWTLSSFKWMGERIQLLNNSTSSKSYNPQFCCIEERTPGPMRKFHFSSRAIDWHLSAKFVILAVKCRLVIPKIQPQWEKSKHLFLRCGSPCSFFSLLFLCHAYKWCCIHNGIWYFFSS